VLETQLETYTQLQNVMREEEKDAYSTKDKLAYDEISRGEVVLPISRCLVSYSLDRLETIKTRDGRTMQSIVS
jgi:hypothetical protein